ncbi:hypothetical protein RclHR1_01480021 [Rhizophagus clarus]|uniref:NmrA-like family domain-containing protein 1 n=1 Tax=Rhizophagus clarus TaxID=94130 RepID=A0A2Z6R645_9GLOM|nr:hypothetical protein RclHR1_01480021 [Rhizophagus clarus]GET00875.1 NmrA-like family domain-containing protein 1 [Rhizophagus clarus]
MSIIGKDPGEEERQGKLVADVAKERGLNWLIYSSLPDSTAESGGKYPDSFIDVNDTGPIIAKIIEEGPTKWNDKKVPIASENVTIKHITNVLTKVIGKPHKFRTLNDEDIARDFPSINNKSIKQMFKFDKEFGALGKDNELQDISIAKKLHLNIKTFEQYVLETYDVL